MGQTEDIQGELERLRGEIDGMDEAIAELVCRRARMVRRIWSLKESAGVAFLDPGREEAILERAMGRGDGSVTPEGMREIFRTLLRQIRPA
jgi:chorismate mutase